MCSIAVGLACAAGVAYAATTFDRYQIILDRSPFGTTIAPTQLVTAVKNLRLSALISLPDGPRAGFVDSQGKNDFVLRLNEKNEQDVQLLAVDYSKERVTIRHEGQLLMLGLQPGDVTVLTASSMLMMGGDNVPSALHPAPPPLPENLSPELRAILTPAPPPDPRSPEGRRYHEQMQQLINPTPAPDISTLALPMPGGLTQPQIQTPEPAQETPQMAPAATRRGNRHGGFGS